VLTGTEDLRTPSAQSATVAAGYSARHLLSIPYTGHSTIGTDPSSCALRAAATFIAQGTAPAACPAGGRFPGTAPRAPRSVRGLASHGRGAEGRTSSAISLTLNDMLRQVEAAETGTFRQGGLRGGRLRLDGRTIRLASYSYIPGSRLSGKIVFGASGPVGSVRVGGRSVVPASVALLPGFKLRVRFRPAKGAAAASVLEARLRRSPGPRPLPIPALAHVR
jgi:TAP-like protein